VDALRGGSSATADLRPDPPRGDPGRLAALDVFAKKAQDENLGWCYWAGGEWCGEGYLLSIQPRKPQDPSGGPFEHRPQMEVLRKYLSP